MGSIRRALGLLIVSPETVGGRVEGSATVVRHVSPTPSNASSPVASSKHLACKAEILTDVQQRLYFRLGADNQPSANAVAGARCHSTGSGRMSAGL